MLTHRIVRFALLCEGTSDRPLVPHLRRLLSSCGASGHTGSRLRRFKKRFGPQRRVLLEQLPIGGALAQVPSWLRLREAVTDFVFWFPSRMP